jgi:hypothetical protein
VIHEFGLQDLFDILLIYLLIYFKSVGSDVFILYFIMKGNAGIFVNSYFYV